MPESRGIRVRRGTRQRWVVEEQGRHFCGCGCDQPIPLRPEHFNIGVPKFLHGHNAKVSPPKPRKDPPPRTPCECGCGALASPGRRFIAGHSTVKGKLSEDGRRRMAAANTGPRSHRYGKTGSASSHWKGGTTRTYYGYIRERAMEHPHARNGYVLQHRLVAERNLLATDPTSEYLTDGYLDPGVDVHHVNGIKDDNRLENLVVMWRGEHTRHHRRLLPQAGYPQKWFDGEVWPIRLGEDVKSTSILALRSSLSRAGRKRGKYVSVRVTGPTTIEMQAKPRRPA